MTTAVLLTLIALFFKHFLFDFAYQPPRMFMNKGKYFHPGGIEHAAYHAIGTFAIFLFPVDLIIAFSAAMFDGLIHYHIDWIKTKFFANGDWGLWPNHGMYFTLGVDQLLHALTYIWLVWMFV